MKFISFILGVALSFACGSSADKADASPDEIPVKDKRDEQIVFTTDSQQAIEKKQGNGNEQHDSVPLKPMLKKAGYLHLPKADPATYRNVSNLVIENVQFTNPTGNNLVLVNCTNIIIRNCYFGSSKEEAISIEKGNNITIEKNLFANNKSCVYAYNTTGGIVIRNNQFVNIKGPVPRGQYVQFNSCTGEGNRIENNKGECWPRESNPEDLISLFKSKGTEQSPILIRNNIFRGGGPSESGGGIMTGDHGGGNVIVENNILVDPGQYGIAASGGKNIVIRNNNIFAKAQKFTNVGIYAWGQAGVECSDIEISGNQVNYISGNKIEPDANNLFIDTNCRVVKGIGTNTFKLSIDDLKLPAHLIDFISTEDLMNVRKEK